MSLYQKIISIINNKSNGLSGWFARNFQKAESKELAEMKTWVKETKDEILVEILCERLGCELLSKTPAVKTAQGIKLLEELVGSMCNYCNINCELHKKETAIIAAKYNLYDFCTSDLDGGGEFNPSIRARILAGVKMLKEKLSFMGFELSGIDEHPAYRPGLVLVNGNENIKFLDRYPASLRL